MIRSLTELFELAIEDVVVLTPNARLTKSLTERYNESQTKNVWPSIKIYPFNQWQQLLWQQYSACQTKPQAIFINEMQSNLLWLDLIKKYSDNFYNAEQLAKKIKQAWANCIAWQVNIDSEEFEQNEETIFFKTIALKYQTENTNKICQTQLTSQLIELLNVDAIKLPKTIILAYFDDFSPEQLILIELLKSKTQISYFDEAQQPQEIYKTQVDSKEKELCLVIEHLKENMNQEGQIGIVVPDLQQYREKLETTLLEHFSKEDFNISMGKALPLYSIVNNAVALLAMSSTFLDLKQVHLLCHSTFIGGSKSINQSRIKSFQRLQGTTEKIFHIDNILKHFSCQTLRINFPKMIDLLTTKTRINVASWSFKFIEALELIGFPGEKILTSEEYQLHIKLSQSLIEFGQLMEPNILLSKIEAIQLLQWQLNQTIFQPKAHNSQVSFIGLLESLGLQFEHLWVMNLNENIMPPKPSPSPFIPIAIQREKHMPHAVEARELLLATKQIERLSSSAKQVVFSHHSESEGKILQASFLIKDLPIKTQTLSNNALIENEFLDTNSIIKKIPIDNINDIHGGSYLIKEQAQCPFRAFSKFRLNIKETRENLDGLDPLDKGIIIHKVMELFWLNVKDQKTLLKLDETEKLQPLLNEIINESIKNIKDKKTHSFNHLFTKLEKQRLHKIIYKYLDLEKQRPPFKVIYIEHQTTFTLNQLNIKLRVDRIDELDNGDYIVIDYKTGATTISSLSDERLTEPQMPIYVLASKKNKALLYAQLQQRNIINKGISENELDIKGVKSIEKHKNISWQTQLDNWQVKLDTLSDEFINGEITAKPSSEALCKNCDFTTLCGLDR